MNKLLRNVTGGVKPACSKGFTLAEVLITLGIIGVVAALTIPSLINKCQKVVWAKQAQETYAILTQAFKRVLADNNTTSLEQTEVWSKLKYNISSSDNPNSNKDFFTELGKYIKISPSTTEKTYSYKNDDDSRNNTTRKSYVINLPNSAILSEYAFYKTSINGNNISCTEMKAHGGNLCNVIAHLFIDINGDKGPNIEGRDIFFFYLSDEGILYPAGGRDDSIWEDGYGSIYWEEDSPEPIYYGIDRTAQLMKEGWKMNY